MKKSKNLRIWLILVKMKIAKNMAFRLSFFGVFFVDGTLFLMQIAMFKAIYHSVGSVGDWDQWEMLFFIGTFSLINALNMTLFFFWIITIPGKINSGEMDYYITKPINPLFHLSLESFDPGSMLLIPASCGLLIYASSSMNISFSWLQVVGYLFYVLMMLILFYDMMVIFRTISFFTQRVDAIERMEGEIISLCMKIPGTLFKGVFKVVFYVLLPYGIMATIPTQFFIGGLTIKSGLLAIAIVAIFTFGTLQFWKLGIKNYQSATS